MFKILDELIHYCTKCKLDLNHRITLVEKGFPKKVLCLTCKTERRYSDPTKSAGGAKKTSATRTPKINPEIVWQEKLRDSLKSPKTYSTESPYNLENRIRHPLFGLGLVVELIHPDKMKVYFSEGIRILKCGIKKAG